MCQHLENQARGLLKNLGLVIGRAKFNVFAVRAEGLIENRPELVAAVRRQVSKGADFVEEVGE